MAGAKVPLSFKIYKGDQLIREEKLSLSVIKLGKVPSAHLKLDDETVSRMHAIIEVNGPGDVSIIDLGSTKGTFVNGQKVNKAKLQSGDTIVVGETRIELHHRRRRRSRRRADQGRRAGRAGHHRFDAAPGCTAAARAAMAAAAAAPGAARTAGTRRVRAAARSVAVRRSAARPRRPFVRLPAWPARQSSARAPVLRSLVSRPRWRRSGRPSVAPAPSKLPRCSATPSSA